MCAHINRDDSLRGCCHVGHKTNRSQTQCIGKAIASGRYYAILYSPRSADTRRGIPRGVPWLGGPGPGRGRRGPWQGSARGSPPPAPDCCYLFEVGDGGEIAEALLLGPILHGEGECGSGEGVGVTPRPASQPRFLENGHSGPILSPSLLHCFVLLNILPLSSVSQPCLVLTCRPYVSSLRVVPTCRPYVSSLRVVPTYRPYVSSLRIVPTYRPYARA
jgi:hypothetical protein